MAEHHEAHERIVRRKQELIERADNLVMMRADGEIGPDQFKKMKEVVDKELSTIDAEGELVSDRVRHWVEITDGYLTFTETASKVFNETTDLKVKKEIVQTLGSNLIIRDKKPLILLTNPLLKLKENRQKFSSILGQFEPKKALDKQGLSSEKAIAFSCMCAGRDSNLRRLMPADLQSALVDRLSTDAILIFGAILV